MIKIYLESALSVETRDWEVVATACIPETVCDDEGEKPFSAPLRTAAKAAGKASKFASDEIVIARLCASRASHLLAFNKEELKEHLENGTQAGGFLDYYGDVYGVSAYALRHLNKRAAFDPFTEEDEPLTNLIVVREFECDPHVGRGLVFGLICEHIVSSMRENTLVLHIEPDLEDLPADQQRDGDRRKQEMSYVFSETAGELKAYRQIETGLLTIASIKWDEIDTEDLVDFSEKLSFMRVKDWARATYGVEAFDPEPEAADQTDPAEDTAPDASE